VCSLPQLLVKKQHLIMKKTIASLITVAIIATSCGKPSQQESLNTEVVDTLSNDTNQALYNQVMGVHDEVMPKMDDLYKLKKALNEKIKNSPDLVDERKKQLEGTVMLLDSASKAMMVWMRQFKPDTLEGDELRLYLEKEMERVNQVKSTMLDAIEKAKAQQ
jgi:hypothetical protein